MRRLPRDRRLDARERAELVGEIVVAYARARQELRRVPIEEAVLRLRGGGAEDGAAAAGDLDESRRLGRAVVRTLAFLPGDTRCLRRSLVLTQLLARRGIPARLVIGARSAPEFLAHAWIELEGEPVLSPLDGDGRFGRLVEI